ncbi:hypothetical protein BBP40_010422 [Aspergillus hancockii]|nr:hypothetical protein BBP40_010422 [Aspergillus hancockii]
MGAFSRWQKATPDENSLYWQSKTGATIHLETDDALASGQKYWTFDKGQSKCTDFLRLVWMCGGCFDGPSPSLPADTSLVIAGESLVVVELGGALASFLSSTERWELTRRISHVCEALSSSASISLHKSALWFDDFSKAAGHREADIVVHNIVYLRGQGNRQDYAGKREGLSFPTLVPWRHPT